MSASNAQIAILENLLVRVQRNRTVMAEERKNPTLSAATMDPTVRAAAPAMAPAAIPIVAPAVVVPAPKIPEPIPLTPPTKKEMLPSPNAVVEAIALDTADAVPLDTDDAIPLESTAVSAVSIDAARPAVSAFRGKAQATAPVAAVSGRPVTGREWSIAAVLERAYRLGQ